MFFIVAKSTKKPIGRSTRKLAKNLILPKQRIPTRPSMPTASSWSAGFSSPSKMYEWFVDCFRMRVDDSYAYSGEAMGIYNPDATKDTVIGELLIFALMARRNNTLPADWDWSKFLQAALPLLPYAFEKSDAQEKYGSENVFSTMTGGRSLRATGEFVYGVGIMDQDATKYNEVFDEVFQDGDDELEGEEDEDDDDFDDSFGFNCFRNSAVFAEVGGMEIWKQFKNDLHLIE